MLTDTNLEPGLQTFAVESLRVHMPDLPSVADWQAFLNELSYAPDGLEKLEYLVTKYFSKGPK